MRLALLGLAALASLAPLAHADPTLPYSNTFSVPGFGPEWTGSALRHTDAPTFGGFNGRYSDNDWICLSLPGVPGPRNNGNDNGNGGGGGGGTSPFVRYTLTFDLYVLDSWDGNNTSWGPDRLVVQANNITKFDESFCNTGDAQSFREPDVGRAEMGFGTRYPDAIYRDISITHELAPGQPIWFTWHTTQLQGMADESWGVDNVRVNYEVIPAPGAAGLAALGSGLLCHRRRRATVA